MAMERYRLFVDETGDRFYNAGSSAIFALTGVMVAESKRVLLTERLDELAARLGRAGTVLHWRENIKTQQERRLVSRCLAELPMTIYNIVVIKRNLPPDSKLREHDCLYNYVLRHLVERASYFASRRKTTASITLAHVKKFPYDHLENYMAFLRQPTRDATIEWTALQGELDRASPADVRELQVADLVAGCLWDALNKDRYGNHSEQYLFDLIPRLAVETGEVTSYGLKLVGPKAKDQMAVYPWWGRFLREVAHHHGPRCAGR